jgi:LysE type translocator
MGPPHSAEIARRCAAGDFWAGIAVLVGASSADAVWAVAVALGVGLLFAAPLARAGMGVVSIALLLALACIDDDFRKAVRERRCANRRRGDRQAVYETRLGEDERSRAQGNQRRAGGVATADPCDDASGDLGIRVNHRRRDDQSSRLFA